MLLCILFIVVPILIGYWLYRIDSESLYLLFLIAVIIVVVGLVISSVAGQSSSFLFVDTDYTVCVDSYDIDESKFSYVIDNQIVVLNNCSIKIWDSCDNKCSEYCVNIVVYERVLPWWYDLLLLELPFKNVIVNVY